MQLTRRSETITVPATCPTTAVDAQWMVLCTLSRQEKVVGEYLGGRGFEYYLPLVGKVTIGPKGRKSSSRSPLFPGYVFLRGTSAQRYAVVDTGRVFQVLAVPDQERFARELEQIKLALAHEAPLERYPFAVVGQRVRVAKGPMTGLEGVIAETGRRKRLVLSVDVLGRGAAMEIDVDLIEPID